MSNARQQCDPAPKGRRDRHVSATCLRADDAVQRDPSATAYARLGLCAGEGVLRRAVVIAVPIALHTGSLLLSPSVPISWDTGTNSLSADPSAQGEAGQQRASQP